ncbi:hypothetical protein A2961_00765 [Candidatus Woesebacteria bacterium RIFCSPLOWO2_01_FULL_39_21]|uniref:Uncharacterized protein n=1 Tax=Candidatus Woesebacteria bacterium RIFCSPLOWO2_01_FULL_39_21 TaxID=1802519 RepID=A0A1F8BMH6_9BACT|nr:MAG: hypothetical protein A2691_02060 [Candidatus Woesebacteria bacterium RIFCSPHIGHO2_01_FULL_39_23]OGM65212.1 MAG: hypothetical protein A2961_00765 [Candidatus Woesebacteria bacterium RIFCSPLOWO2_01_FULL_39_21]
MQIYNLLRKEISVPATVLSIIILFLIVGFLVWMNVTNGHYMYLGCCDSCGYYTLEDKSNFNEEQCRVVDCGISRINTLKCKLLTTLAVIDFNK